MARSNGAAMIGVVLALVAALVWQSSFIVTWLHHNMLAPSEFPAIMAKFPSSSPSSPASHGGHRIDYVRVKAADDSADFELRSCEDITEYGDSEHSQIVLASCDPSRHEWNTVMGSFKNPQRQGSLWYLTPLAHNPRAHRIKLVNWPRHRRHSPTTVDYKNNKGAQWADNLDKDFHPLGIRFTEDKSRLFVINHERLESTVEVFQLSTTTPGLPMTARYLMTIKHSSLNAPNAIQPVSSNSFFISHDHKCNKRSTRLVDNVLNFYETIFARPWSRIDFVTFDDPSSSDASVDDDDTEVLATNVRVKTVANDIAFANGIAYSPSSQLFAVSSSTHRTVHVYKVNPTDFALSDRIDISVPFLADNLSLAPKHFFKNDDDDDEKETRTTFVATGHPAYVPMLLEALNVSTPDWFPQAGSWSVALTRTRDNHFDRVGAEGDDDDDVAFTSGRATRTPGWKLITLFASKGGYKHDGKSFGTSTTTVVGLSSNSDGQGQQRWMVVAGLYEKGLQLIRQV
ncbi:hypothetical protein ACM66B_003347 [Microbotryomycetes sp. NB124-2]